MTLLCQLDAGTRYERYANAFWYAVEPGIYRSNLDGVYPDIDPLLLVDVPASELGEVTSLFASGGRIPRVDALQDLRDGVGFVFDAQTKNLTLRLSNFDQPGYFDIILGAAIGSRFGGLTERYDGQFFRDEIISPPVIRFSRDRLFFGQVSFDQATFSVGNADGRYDLFGDLDVYGQQVRFYYGEDGAAFPDEFVQIATLNVQDFDVGHELTIRASDPRKQLQTPLPDRIVELEDSPDFGEPLPLAYGRPRNVKPVILDDDEGYDPTKAQSYLICMADTEHRAITELTATRVSGQTIGTDSAADVYISGVDLAAGTFLLNKKAGVDLDLEQIRIDFNAEGADTAGAIVKDLLLTYTEVIPAQIAEGIEHVAEDIELVLYEREQTSVIEVIESIMVSIKGFFIIDGTGVHRIDLRDTTAEPLLTVDRERITNLNRLFASRDAREFASRIRVRYDNGRVTQSAEDEDKSVKRYRQSRAQTIDTVLKNKVDADAYALDTVRETREIVPTFSIGTDMRSIITGLRIAGITDTIEVDLARLSSDWLGRRKVEIEAVSYDFRRGLANLEARLINE